MEGSIRVKQLASFLQECEKFFNQCVKVEQKKMQIVNMNEYESKYKSMEEMMVILEQKADALLTEVTTRFNEDWDNRANFSKLYAGKIANFEDTELAAVREAHEKMVDEILEIKMKREEEKDTEFKKLQPILEKIMSLADALKMDPVEGIPVEHMDIFIKNEITPIFRGLVNCMLPFVKNTMMILDMVLDEEMQEVKEFSDFDSEGTLDYLLLHDDIFEHNVYDAIPEDEKKTIDQLKAVFRALGTGRGIWDVPVSFFFLLKAAQKSFIGLRYTLQMKKEVAGGTSDQTVNMGRELKERADAVRSKFETIFFRLRGHQFNIDCGLPFTVASLKKEKK